MKTYYIVENVDGDGDKCWCAYPDGIMERLGIFTFLAGLIDSYTTISADMCEKKLRTYLAARKIKPKVVRVIQA